MPRPITETCGDQAKAARLRRHIHAEATARQNDFERRDESELRRPLQNYARAGDKCTWAKPDFKSRSQPGGAPRLLKRASASPAPPRPHPPFARDGDSVGGRLRRRLHSVTSANSHRTGSTQRAASQHDSTTESSSQFGRQRLRRPRRPSSARRIRPERIETRAPPKNLARLRGSEEQLLEFRVLRRARALRPRKGDSSMEAAASIVRRAAAGACFRRRPARRRAPARARRKRNRRPIKSRAIPPACGPAGSATPLRAAPAEQAVA